MKTSIIKLFALCVVALLCDTSLAQIGAFNVTNNTNCSLKAMTYAYEGSCASFDCNSVGNTGWMTISANSTTNIASTYSGMGDVWGRVKVTDEVTVSEDGNANCFSGSGYITCNSTQYSVQWGGCHSAQIP